MGLYKRIGTIERDADKRRLSLLIASQSSEGVKALWAFWDGNYEETAVRGEGAVRPQVRPDGWHDFATSNRSDPKWREAVRVAAPGSLRAQLEERRKKSAGVWDKAKDGEPDGD